LHANSKDIALDDLHTCVLSHDGVGTEQQIEFFLDRDIEWIDLNRRRVLADALHRIANIHRFARNRPARFCNLDRQSCDAFDFGFTQIGT